MKKSLVCAILIAALSACGGGGGGGGGGNGGGVVPSGGSTPCPTGYTGSPPACTPPQSSSMTVQASTSPVNVTLAPVGGVTGTLQLPPAQSAANVLVYESTNPVIGPILNARHHRLIAGPDQAYLYFFVGADNTDVTFNGTLNFTLTLPSFYSTTAQYYLAALFSDGTWGTIAGPVTVQNHTLAIGTPLNGTLPPTYGIYVALYSGQFRNPGPPIAAYPGSIDLQDLTATQALTITARHPGSTTLSVDSSNCNGIASLTPNTGDQNSDTYTVGAIAVGTCSLHATDGLGNSLDVPVTVTQTKVIVQ